MDAELRKDLIVNRWVLISPRRGKRPHDYNAANASLKQQAAEHPGPCPFCFLHESESGEELIVFEDEGCVGSPTHPCWRVRVVRNKFPAVSPDLEIPKIPLDSSEDGLIRPDSIVPGFGSHEVVIETPQHDQVFASLSLNQISAILRAYRSRLETLQSDPRYKYCQIFKNNGNAAGASMVHSHSQIIALPVVPKEVEDEFAGAKAFHEKCGNCVFCEVIKFDLDKGNVRLIDQSPQFITVAPFAAQFPYETWILPRKHNSSFGSASDDELRGLAEILKLTLMKMDKAFDYPPFNFMLQTAPLQAPEALFYHWYVRVVPHLVSIAGFELATGCHINPVAPEQAAELLRNLSLEEPDENPAKPNGTADHESPKIRMVDLGHDVKKKEAEPERLIYMADLGKDVEPQRLIHMADLGKDVKTKEEEPQRLIHMADLGKDLEKKDVKSQRLIYMADLGNGVEQKEEEPQRLIYMADLGKDLEKKEVEPQKLIYMADLGENDQNPPPERLIYMADL